MIEILNTQDKNGYELMWGCYDILAKLPDDCTNGDMIMAMFDCMVLGVTNGKVYVEHIYFPFDEEWWNAPYKIKEK